MPQWTEQQLEAIHTRGQDILVSAAAGSGKTAVLSARVGEFVEQGGRLDRLLVVTFTKLAAGEMRSRIAREISQRASQKPSDAHLRRQSLTLYKAKISTIDSFGIDLLRRNFQAAGVAPDFSVLDEGELSVLRASILQGQLEEYYREFPQGFDAFLHLFGGEINSNNAEAVIRGVADKLEQIPFADQWIDRQRARLSDSDTPCRVACELLLVQAREYREIFAQILRAAPYKEKGMDSLRSDYDFLCSVCSLLEHGDWDGACACVSHYNFPTSASRGAECRETALYSEYRGALSKGKKDTVIQFFNEEIFRLTRELWEEDLESLRLGLEFLYDAVKEFRRRVLEEMHRRSSYSFAAVSQLALQLVVAEYSHETGEFVPTPAALRERECYDEVLIDEYQDVNDVQDLFFRAVTRDNCFAVGDVKQSIYGFRGANPANFLRKKETCKVIALNKNFRSRSGVLAFVNFLFRGLFSKDVGGMEYDETEALFAGRGDDDANPYPPSYHETLPEAGESIPPARKREKEPHAELLLIPTPYRKADDAPDNAEGTAMVCAKLIRDAMESGATVFDKNENTSRPMRYSDIAILLRTSLPLAAYQSVFRQWGIPLLSSDGETFLDAPEVGGILAFLQAINDPWDDLSLFVTLTGSVFSFTPEQVAAFHCAKDKRPLWESLTLAAETDERAAAVIHTLEHYRILGENLSVPRLIWTVYTDTDYLALESATDPSARDTLMKFYSFACRYPRNDGLFGFLAYAEQARRSGSVKDTGAAPDGDFVRIMTIHKSKGLEFAWCIVPQLEGTFTVDREGVRFDGELGVAPKVRNEQQTAEYTTLLREVIGLKNKRAEVAERLRVLYVALTRARDRLTMIGRCSDKLENLDLHGLHSEQGAVRISTLLANNNYCKIILDRAVSHPQGAVIQSAWLPAEEEEGDLRVAFVGVPTEICAVSTQDQGLSCGLDGAELERRFSYRYDGHLSAVPAKVSVTEIAKAPADPDSALLIASPPVSRPKFLDEDSLTAAERGTALHTYCQFADLNRPVKDEIQRLTAEGHLSPLAARWVDEEALNALLTSPLMEQIRSSLGYEREVRFVCRIPVSYYSGNPSEEGEMLMQGAMDLLCETEEGYLIVDFKSDRATEPALLSRYARQLNLYAAAVRRLYEKPVIGCKIWSFFLKKAIDVAEELL